MSRSAFWVLISSIIFYGVNGQYWPYYQQAPLRQEAAASGGMGDFIPPEKPPETHERPPTEAPAENQEELQKDLNKDKDERTTIPESDVINALKVEVGTYSPFVDEFKYYNAQSMKNYSRYTWNENHRCNEDYLKCLTDMPIPQILCSYHDYESIHGVKTQHSPCELYYKECRRGYRKWKVIGIGYCFTGDGYWKFQTLPARRFFDSQLLTAIVSPFKYFSDVVYDKIDKYKHSHGQK